MGFAFISVRENRIRISAVRFRYEIVKTYYNTENLSSQQEKAEFLD